MKYINSQSYHTLTHWQSTKKDSAPEYGRTWTKSFIGAGGFYRGGKVYTLPYAFKESEATLFASDAVTVDDVRYAEPGCGYESVTLSDVESKTLVQGLVQQCTSRDNPGRYVIRVYDTGERELIPLTASSLVGDRHTVSFRQYTVRDDDYSPGYDRGDIVGTREIGSGEVIGGIVVPSWYTYVMICEYYPDGVDPTYDISEYTQVKSISSAVPSSPGTYGQYLSIYDKGYDYTKREGYIVGCEYSYSPDIFNVSGIQGFKCVDEKGQSAIGGAFFRGTSGAYNGAHRIVPDLVLGYVDNPVGNTGWGVYIDRVVTDIYNQKNFSQLKASPSDTITDTTVNGIETWISEYRILKNLKFQDDFKLLA